MSTKIIISVVLVLALFGSVQCINGVTELTDDNFASEVQSEPTFWIVLFAADWVILLLTFSAATAKNSNMLIAVV